MVSGVRQARRIGTVRRGDCGSKNRLGFKMVLRIQDTESVESVQSVIEGEGGYNEDDEYFGELANVLGGTSMIKLKRAYEAGSKADGLRILVERLWPRGVSKKNAAIDLWLKVFAPSTELREWYGHDPAKWRQFRKRYWRELEAQGDLLALLKIVTQENTVTFVYAASDEERNSALVLKEFLEHEKK